MALDISSLTRTGDFINYTKSSGSTKLTFGNLFDKVGNDLKLLKREVNTVADALSFIRGNLTGPKQGNFAGAGQRLESIRNYLKVWDKIIIFKNIMIYALDHVIYNDSNIEYTAKSPRFSAEYIANQLTTSINEGTFYEIYTAINAATNLTDIKNQLTEADMDGDILDEINLDTLEAGINSELSTVNAKIGLARLAIIEYANFLNDNFTDEVAGMTLTLDSRDLITIYELIFEKVNQLENSLQNYNQATPGPVKINYYDQTKLYFSELETILSQFNQIAEAFSTEITQILLDRESLKYDLIEKQIAIMTSLQSLKAEVTESLELIDDTLSEIRYIFEIRINNLGTLPS